jgi:hypothetical protein
LLKEAIEIRVAGFILFATGKRKKKHREEQKDGETNL